MKLLLPSALLVCSVSAFSRSAPTMTISIDSKANPPKITGNGEGQAVPSRALPYGRENTPAILEGLPGSAGFDPVFLSVQKRFDNLFTLDLDSVSWMREAELMNGRIAMMGVLGMIVPGLLGNTASPLDVTGEQLFPAFLSMAWIEWFRIKNILAGNYEPGDMHKWGQGQGERFNPFGFNYSDEEYFDIKTSEIKHCRLAMIGFLGLYLQAAASGESIVAQLGHSLSAPDWYAKAGNFMPEGI